MRILFLIDEIITQGGTEQHLYELSLGLSRAGHEVTVVSLQEGAYAEAFRSCPGISYDCLNVVRIYDSRGIAALVRVAGLIRGKGIDIVQSFHTASDLIGPVAALLSMRHPVVLSSRRDLGYTKSPRHVALQHWINPLVDGILANSGAVRRSIRELEGYEHDRIQIIYNGIHCDRYSSPDPAKIEVLRRELCLSPGCCVVGSVGNIRHVKGYDLMVEVADRLCRENRNVLFIHAGDGEGRSDLESRCRAAGIERQFRFLGARKEIPEILAIMDIYLQPSRTEGFSNAILEAMSSGLAVVATRVGGTPEIIDDGVNGFLVESEDVEGLVTTLSRLVDESALRKKVGEAGRKKVLEEFGIGVMIDNYQRYYYERLQGLRPRQVAA